MNNKEEKTKKGKKSIRYCGVIVIAVVLTYLFKDQIGIQNGENCEECKEKNEEKEKERETVEKI